MLADDVPAAAQEVMEIVGLAETRNDAMPERDVAASESIGAEEEDYFTPAASMESEDGHEHASVALDVLCSPSGDEQPRKRLRMAGQVPLCPMFVALVAQIAQACCVVVAWLICICQFQDLYCCTAVYFLHESECVAQLFEVDSP